MGNAQFGLLDDSDYEAIAAEEMGEVPEGAPAPIPEVEDQRCFPAEVAEVDEIDREKIVEEIAEEMQTVQGAEVVMGERKAEEEVLARQEREIEDLRQRLAEKERQEEVAWAVWGVAFLVLLCGTVTTGVLGISFNDSFLIQTALYLFLFLLVSLLFPEVVVRTSGISLKNIWQKLTAGSLKSSPPSSHQET